MSSWSNSAADSFEFINLYQSLVQTVTREGSLESVHSYDKTGSPASRKADATPHASALIESMRDIGYSLETALADVIDNVSQRA